jgi:hypothetical protein
MIALEAAGSIGRATELCSVFDGKVFQLRLERGENVRIFFA